MTARGESKRLRTLPPPGLLSWQVCLCGALLGILSLEQQVPAVIGLVLLLFAHFICRKDRTALALAAAAFPLGLGWAWQFMPVAPAKTLEFADDRKPDFIQGRIDEVRAKPGGRLQLLLDEVVVATETGQSVELPGRLLWTWDEPTFRPMAGRNVSVELHLKRVRSWTNPGLFDLQRFYARQDIHYRCWSRGDGAETTWGPAPHTPWASLRTLLHDALMRSAPDNQGRALLAALLLGDRFHLSPQTVQLYREASLAHSLALSGMHVGFAALLSWLPAIVIGRIRPGVYLRIPRRKLAMLTAAPPVLLYVWLGGAGPGLVRAALMFGFWGALLLAGRGRVVLDGLFAALAVIALVSPLSVFDIRLQFSALAVAGIGLLLPIIEGYLSPSSPDCVFASARVEQLRKKLLGPQPLSMRKDRKGIRTIASFFIGLAGLSIAAQTALLPLTSAVFGHTPINPLLNLVWLPLLGMVVFPLGVAGLVASALPGLAGPGEWLLTLDALLLQAGVDFLAGLSQQGLIGEAAVLRPLWPQIVGFYGLVVGFLMVDAGRMRSAAVCGALCLALLALPHVEDGLDSMRNRVRLTLVDVGQGLCQVVEAPGGRRALIDGGGFYSQTFDVGRSVVSAHLTRGTPPRLDVVAMSHADLDHYGGLLHALEFFRIGAFVHNGGLPDGKAGEVASSLPSRALVAGDVVSLGNEVELQAAHPRSADDADDDNNSSLVLRLTWRGRGLAVLPGDIEVKGTQAMLERSPDLSAHVLVLPHHGSRDALSLELYDAVQPVAAAAGLGYNNRFGYPHPEVAEALRVCGVGLATTGEHGAIRLTWSDPDRPPLIETARAAEGF